MVSKYKTGGWYKESYRHSLASRGISTKPLDYNKKGVTGVGTLGTSIGLVGASTVVASDIPSIIVDVIGSVSSQSLAFTPFMVIGGVTYGTAKGLRVLSRMHKEKKISDEKLKELLLKNRETGKPIIITKEELADSIFPEQSHVVSVTEKGKAELSFAKNKKLPSDIEIFNFQDKNQENVIHSGWDKGNSYRFGVLEGAGDVFRELTNPNPHFSYVEEKLNRIEKHIEKEESWVHPEDSYDYSKINNEKRFEKMINQWKSQPTNRDIQKVAISLNLAVLNKDFNQAKDDIEKIRSSF